MSSWAAGVLMALCLLRPPAGQAKLPAPQNVTLLSKDFDMILTWAPGEGSPAGVTYTVRYQSQQQQKKWLKVPHCKNIHRTSCNLTCELPNYYVKVRGRVKAAWGRCQSPWVESQFKGYHLDVELAPPELKLSMEKNSIQVNASFPLPPCVQNLLWMYDLNLWEAGSEDKRTYEQNSRKAAVTINTTALRGNYCLSARASYQSIYFKYSKFSQPLCVLLNHKAVEWKLPFAASIPVLVLLSFLSSLFVVCLLKRDAKQKKMPQTLDLSPLTAAGADFHCELSAKEFSRDHLICTEIAVSQRKANKASARNSLQQVAPFLSSSSSSSEEEEEEEEEGSSTFIPYTGMLRFPKRHLTCHPPRADQGKTSLDSGTGDLSVGSESELDLSALGFTFFPVGKSEVDTSGSQASEKSSLSHSSSLGRISLTDVRFPAQGDTDREGCLDVTLLQTLTEGSGATLGAQGQALPCRCYQRAAELHTRRGGTEQRREQPSGQRLAPSPALQLAEDEGIASDWDWDSDTEAAGTPPAAGVLCEAFQTSPGEGMHQPKFEFKGYEHAHYMARS